MYRITAESVFCVLVFFFNQNYDQIILCIYFCYTWRTTCIAKNLFLLYMDNSMYCSKYFLPYRGVARANVSQKINCFQSLLISFCVVLKNMCRTINMKLLESSFLRLLEASPPCSHFKFLRKTATPSTSLPGTGNCSQKLRKHYQLKQSWPTQYDH